MDKYIGRLLDNRYEILEVIGSGGMAVVYKARCHRLNRLVAIKILKDDFVEDDEFRRRFHAESQAIAMLSHPNIVSVYDVSTSDEADYIVMELIDGISLKQYMEKKGILNWKETLHFAIQIAKALDHAHSRGVVHRDIKPHNVMVLKNGSVKVSDFGIARMMSKGNTLTKEALGSVHYISPEQAKGGRVDNRSDIYSLGVVMYEMMSGRPPYDGETPVSVAIQHINGGAVMPSTLNPNIPGGLEQIIMKAMAHGIDGRYATASAMLTDMDEFRKNPAILFDYNTPPLDAVTDLPKPPLTLTPEPPKSTAERVSQRAEPPRRRPVTPPVKSRTDRKPATQQRTRTDDENRSRVATIAIIACSAVMVVAIAIVLIILLNNGAVTPQKQVEVPSLIGLNYSEQKDIVEGKGFKIEIQKMEYHDKYASDVIYSQEPVGGSMVTPGSTIYVFVSRGTQNVPDQLKNLQGETKKQAELALINMQLELEIAFEEEHSDGVDVGCVTRTDPVAGTQLKEGQKVKVYISKGPAAKVSKMPAIDGKTADQIKILLLNQDFNLNIRIEQEFNSEIAVGAVIRTDPMPGEDLESGQDVIIYVSKGIEQKYVPNVIAWEQEAAKERLAEEGFKFVKIELVDSDKTKGVVIDQSHKNVDLDVTTEIILQVSKGPQIKKTLIIPLDDEVVGPYKLKIALRIDSETEEVLHETTIYPKKGENTYKYEVSGTGKQLYNIYIDGSDEALIKEVDFTTK